MARKPAKKAASRSAKGPGVTAAKPSPPARSGDVDGDCPVKFALDVMGDRWTLLILRDMFFKGKSRYRQFLTSSEGISTNILASRLKHLEEQNLVTKAQDAENASRFIYLPTPKAIDLLPVLLEMVVWSTRYDPQPGVADCVIEGAPRHLLRRWRTDREALLREMASNAQTRRG